MPWNRRRWGGALAGGLLCGAIVGAALWIWWPVRTGHADWHDAAQVSAGEKLYQANCASCHGDRLQGQPNWRDHLPNGRLPAPPHDETGHTWHHPDQVLFELVRHGLKPPLAPTGYQSDMPAFEGKLSDPEIWAVLAFIKSRWPPSIRERQQRMTDQAGLP